MNVTAEEVKTYEKVSLYYAIGDIKNEIELRPEEFELSAFTDEDLIRIAKKYMQLEREQYNCEADSKLRYLAITTEKGGK